MFIAKFNQTSGHPFKADKNDNFPFIGTVLAGRSKATIINGTIFQREGLEPNKLYACENQTVEFERPDGEIVHQEEVVIVGEVSVLEYMKAKKELGAPVLDRTAVAVAQEQEVAVAAVAEEQEEEII